MEDTAAEGFGGLNATEQDLRKRCVRVLRSDSPDGALAGCCMDNGLIAPLPASGSAWIDV